MRRGFALAAALLLLVASRRAAAEDPPGCGGPGHPGIVLRAEGLTPALRAQIAEQLRAALAGRSFDLCEPTQAGGAVAELDVSGIARANGAPADGAPGPTNGGVFGVAVTLSVRDEVTDKRVARDLDLRRIPEDGRALVIAQAADELLRASWAELLIADAPKPRAEVPPEVVRAVPPPADALPPSAPAPPAAVFEIGVAAAIERFGSGHTQLGPDLTVGVFPLPRLGFVARGGLRSAAREDAPSGSVDPSGVVAGLAAMVGALPRTGRMGLDAGAELFVTQVTYDAEARPGTGGRALGGSGTAVAVSALARGWMIIAPPVRATIGLGVGAPLHTVRALAADSTVASISGVLLGAQLGLAGAW